MRFLETSLVAAATIVWVSAAGAGPQGNGRTAPAADSWTPVVAEQLAPNNPTPVLGTDGRYHISYELLLLNARRAQATVNSIAALDDAQHVIVTYSGGSLLSVLRDPASPGVAGRDDIIPGNGTRLVLLDLSFATRDAVPKHIVHRFDVLAAANPAAMEATPLHYEAGPVTVGDGTLPVVSPPLRGKGWVVLNGCCGPIGAHRAAALPVNGNIWIAQRYAIDFMRLDAKGRIVHGDESKVHNYSCYGADVLAVANATVVSAMDNLSDQVPGKLPDPASLTVATVDGNHVVLDLGNGRYAFYAHLMKGSVVVKVGDTVKTGQVIAKVGNTGNTSGPHLHFHIMDSASVLGSDGLPYVYAHFALHGAINRARFEAAPTVAGDYSDGWTAVAQARSEQLPLDLQIVDFPE